MSFLYEGLSTPRPFFLGMEVTPLYVVPHEGRQPNSLVGGAARGLWLDASDAVVLDGVHETRVCGEGGVVDKLETKDLAEPGSSSLCQLCNGGDVESVGVEVLLDRHVDGHLSGKALNVLVNVDFGAPELLA